MAEPTLLEVADALYALPPAEFTAARDAAAKERKAAGDTDVAAQVKTLHKPSVAAWAVNQLVRREAGQVEQVLQVGAALREAQAGMSATDLKELTRQRRQLTAAVTQQARGLAADAGTRLTASVADQVEATLTAAMVDPECGRALRSGLLVAALHATGVGEVDVAAAVALPDALGFVASPVEAPAPETTPGRPDLRVVPDPDADAKALAAAQEALDAAQGEVDTAQEALDGAVATVEGLEAQALQTRSEIEELQRRLAELESSQEDVEEQLSEAEDARDEAQGVLDEAASARDDAQGEVDRRS